MANQLNHDIKFILKGAELISRALIQEQRVNVKMRLQNANVRCVLQNSSVKNQQPFQKSFNDVMQQYASVVEGVTKFTSYIIRNAAYAIQQPEANSEIINERDVAEMMKKIDSNTSEYSILKDKQHFSNNGLLKPEEMETVALSDESWNTNIQNKLHFSNNTGLLKPELESVNTSNESLHFMNKNDNLFSLPEKPHKQVDKVHQMLSDKSKERKVPASRISRMISYGGLAAGLGIGALAELTRRTLGVSESSNLLLTDANVERIVNTLCRMRGAALKLGQMISIQDNTLVSPQLQKIFERVRQSADFMPTNQMEEALTELGEDWATKMRTFEKKPFAAASIGQVHLATLFDGTEVAIKIQYPGIAKSIDSDIDNLMGILRTWKILPESFFHENALVVARKELAWELDYIREAECAKRYREMLQEFPEYYVPRVIDDLCSKQVYTTELIYGLTLDKCVDLDQDTRNYIAIKMLQLCLLELFKFSFMQTDPNWSNFFYNAESKQICLLDFGACRDFGKSFIDNYLLAIKASACKDREGILQHSKDLKFLTGYESKLMENAHIEAVLLLGEPFAEDKEFDFGTGNTTQRIQSIFPVLLHNRLVPPPEETYSLHRKLAGALLLCTKLKAKINCKPIFDDIYLKYTFSDKLTKTLESAS